VAEFFDIRVDRSLSVALLLTLTIARSIAVSYTFRAATAEQPSAKLFLVRQSTSLRAWLVSHGKLNPKKNVEEQSDAVDGSRWIIGKR